jgi:DNA-binding PadR family transcriptional regulator
MLSCLSALDKAVKPTMNLTLEDVALLKQLKAAGEGGRTIRAYNMRLALDRLAKGGYVVARPTGLDQVHYRITERGQEGFGRTRLIWLVPPHRPRNSEIR